MLAKTPEFTAVDRATGAVPVIAGALAPEAALKNAILNSANVAIIATDEKGVIQFFNSGAERMLGYTAAEIVNQITPAHISDPQEVMARAVILSREHATPIAPGVRGFRLQGVARTRRQVRIDLHPQGRQPLSGNRVGHGIARRGRQDRRLSRDRLR